MNLLLALTLVQRFTLFCDAGTLPHNWRDFIDPDSLHESVNDQSRYSPEMWQGDVSSFEPGERPPNAAANAVDKADLMWPNNTVPYHFATERSVRFGPAKRTRITEAMEIIMHLTGQCVKFVERTSETDYVKFQKGYQCFSDVGRTGGKQIVSLSSACVEHYGCIQHELLHVLGFFHEQSRLDRDDYVTINWDNIAEESKDQFTKHVGQTYGLPYDYESVMHYEIRAFAVDDELPTIVPKVRKTRLGQKENLSSLDVARIYRRFKCTVPSGQSFLKPRLQDNQEDSQQSRPITVAEQSPSKSDHRESARMEPFPSFSGEPMSRDQCAYQFNANCANFGYTTTNCTTTLALTINCSTNATPVQLQDMATGMSKGPLRAILVRLSDGEQLNFDNFAVIRKQIVGLNVFNCRSSRTTGKLPQLQYSNLLAFHLRNCNAVSIKRSDFAESIKLKMVNLANTTIRDLERETFTDLPALKYLSLEDDFHQMSTFSKQIRDYLKRLHCDCEFSWFRRWWNANRQLLRIAAVGDVFMIQDSWQNGAASKEEAYLPIDCSSLPFPSGAASIDFKQQRFSINDDNDLCTSTSSEAMESFPVFSAEPMTSEQCALQFTSHCWPTALTRSNCTTFRGLEIGCVKEASSEEINGMATAMAKTPPRPTRINLFDGISVSFPNFASIREQIVKFHLWYCRNNRATSKPYELRLVNLLHFSLGYCYSLNIEKKDLQRITKLRIIELINCTIHTLERDTFTDLPSLRVLALESGLKNVPVFSDEIRDYISHLHCSCEFAWYRRWWTKSKVLVRQAGINDIYSIPGAYNNPAYSREDIYLPVDCSSLPSGSSSLNLNQIEFSFDEDECPP